MFNFSSNNIKYKRQRIVRIISTLRRGQGTGQSTGSGFFIDKTGNILTCFHVVIGAELRNIRQDPRFIATAGDDEHSKLENFFANTVTKIEVEFPDGSIQEAKLEKFDERYDLVLLRLEDFSHSTKFFKMDFKSNLGYGDNVFFCGFQHATGYSITQYPFSVNKGIVSTFPETTIGGERYKHIQINSINLGGNSGAPLFKRKNNQVVGIINGNMNMGNDNVAIMNPQGQCVRSPLRFPLSIAYATPSKLLKENTDIFS